MSSQYTSEYPSGTSFPDKFKKFFEEFYKISDTPEKHELYASQFTENATLVMASKTVKGRSEITTLREGMWSKVASRAHNPIKIFPFGSVSDSAKEAEVMLHGTVDYKLKAGGESHVPWAARGTITEDTDGVLKWSYYQVYLDTGAQTPAK